MGEKEESGGDKNLSNYDEYSSVELRKSKDNDWHPLMVAADEAAVAAEDEGKRSEDFGLANYRVCCPANSKRDFSGGVVFHGEDATDIQGGHVMIAMDVDDQGGVIDPAYKKFHRCVISDSEQLLHAVAAGDGGGEVVMVATAVGDDAEDNNPDRRQPETQSDGVFVAKKNRSLCSTEAIEEACPGGVGGEAWVGEEGRGEI